MEEIKEAIEQSHLFISRIRNEISKQLVGQEKLVDSLLIGLLTGGHVLIEGVPEIGRASCRERV